MNKTEPLYKNLPKKLLIKNGTIIDPYSEKEYKADIILHNGRIENISEDIVNVENIDVIDAEYLYVSPGFFDMHVHLREPGYDRPKTLSQERIQLWREE